MTPTAPDKHHADKHTTTTVGIVNMPNWRRYWYNPDDFSCQDMLYGRIAAMYSVWPRASVAQQSGMRTLSSSRQQTAVPRGWMRNANQLDCTDLSRASPAGRYDATYHVRRMRDRIGPRRSDGVQALSVRHLRLMRVRLWAIQTKVRQPREDGRVYFGPQRSLCGAPCSASGMRYLRAAFSTALYAPASVRHGLSSTMVEHQPVEEMHGRPIPRRVYDVRGHSLSAPGGYSGGCSCLLQGVPQCLHGAAFPRADQPGQEASTSTRPCAMFGLRLRHVSRGASRHAEARGRPRRGREPDYALPQSSHDGRSGAYHTGAVT